MSLYSFVLIYTFQFLSLEKQYDVEMCVLDSFYLRNGVFPPFLSIGFAPSLVPLSFKQFCPASQYLFHYLLFIYTFDI